jgi:hypothetical protein
MSIYVYISRRADPFNDEGPSITGKEWLLSVDGDSAFRIAREDQSKWLGENARIWTGHQHAPAFAFDWVHGQIEVKNPDAQTIAKMQELPRSSGQRSSARPASYSATRALTPVFFLGFLSRERLSIILASARFFAVTGERSNLGVAGHEGPSRSVREGWLPKWVKCRRRRGPATLRFVVEQRTPSHLRTRHSCSSDVALGHHPLMAVAERLDPVLRTAALDRQQANDLERITRRSLKRALLQGDVLADAEFP